MTPLAAVAWAAHLGWLRLEGTPLALLDSAAARYILLLGMLAELVVDKYMSGPCGWAFDEVKAVVVKDGKVGDRNFMTGTTSPVIDNNTDGLFEPYCYRPDDHDCPVRQNSDPVPVLLLCSIGRMSYPKPRDYFTCGDRFPDTNYKQTHLLDARTSEIALDLYDLTLESSPIPIKFPQSTEAAP